MGRHTDYKESYADLAYNYCLLGAIDSELADFFDVSEQTINAWKQKQPEFLESLKKGKSQADAKVAQSLYKRATGFSHVDTKFATNEGMITDKVEYDRHYPSDTTACIFWLKNRQPKKWREKQEIDHTTDGEQIHIYIPDNGTNLEPNE